MTNLEQDVQKDIQNEKHFDFGYLNKAENSTDDFGCSWWENFVKVLILLPYSKDCRQTSIETLKDYYKDNERKIRTLQQFECEYKSDNAILWYTRDTFLYRLLNQALRQHNIEVMLLFGFYLQDFYQQMKVESKNIGKRHLENPIITLYRGQMMRLAELKRLKVGDLIINNSFISTTFDRTVASFFLAAASSPTTDEFQGILFQINIDVRQQQGVNPYADISHLSQISDEDEVLFMTGSPFKISEIKFDDDLKIWNLELELYFNIHLKDSSTFENIDYTERRLLKNYIDLLPLGIYRASPDEINLVYDRLIDLFPLEEKWITAERLHTLAVHEQAVTLDRDKALIFYNQAVDTWQAFLNDDAELNCSLNLAEINSAIAVRYIEGVRYPQIKLAEKHFDIAIDYLRRAMKNSHTNHERIDILDQLSSRFQWKMGQSNESRLENATIAIEYQELAIDIVSKSQIPNIKTGHRLLSLVELYEAIDNYDRALSTYEIALEFYLAQSSIDVSVVCNTYDKIADIYLKYKNDYQAALKHQLISHKYVIDNCKVHSQKPEDNDSNMKTKLVTSNEKLADIYIKLDQYQLAIEHLSTALKLNEEVNRDYHSRDQSNADIEIKLADIRLKLHDYEIAYHHLENALKIYCTMEQLSNQSDMRETESEEETTDDDIDSESSSTDCSETEIEKIEKKMNYIQNILMAKQD